MEVNNQYEQVKGIIIEKFEKDFVNFDAICNITDEIFDQGWKIKEKSDYEYVMSLLFSKAFKTYKGINILCKEGYGQDAGILLRSLFEIYVNIAYISKDESEKRAKRYYEYSYIKKQHLVELFDNYRLEKEGFKDAGQSIQRNREEIYKLYNKVKGNYKNENGGKDEFHWSGKSIKRMASECGLGTDHAYVFFIFSQLVHSSSMTESSYVHANITERQIASDVGPSEEYIEAVLPHSNNIFLKILERFDSVFNSGKERKIEEIKSNIGLE